MPPDGGWPQRLEQAGAGEAETAAVARVQALVAAAQTRLAAADPALDPPPSTPELSAALQALSDRLADLETLTAGRQASLERAVVELLARLDAAAPAAPEASSSPAALPESSRPSSSAPVGAATPLQARVAPAPAHTSPDPPLVRGLLAAASVAALVAVVGAAALLAVPPPARTSAWGGSAVGLASPTPLRRAQTSVAPATAANAPATNSKATSPVLGSGPPARPGDTYAAVSEALARGEATAFARLVGLAETGDSAAQQRLAAIYDAGAPGVPRDPAAARAWSRRGAEGGDRVAMHNYALFLANGEGGARDFEAAAAWFRKAADRGVVDSQFNLALMYEAGRGVPQNLREAYRWFAIAANAGDLQAREKQVALQDRLAAAERGALDQAAQGFRPGASAAAPAAAAVVIPPATTVAETQALLARQGYYVGPTDGVPSPSFRAATQAYLKDHPAAGAAVAGRSPPS